jgi:hypothetical protein
LVSYQYKDLPSKSQVNPVRNSSGPLNPAEIILKYNPAEEQQGIISNGVNPDQMFIISNFLS